MKKENNNLEENNNENSKPKKRFNKPKSKKSQSKKNDDNTSKSTNADNDDEIDMKIIFPIYFNKLNSDNNKDDDDIFNRPKPNEGHLNEKSKTPTLDMFSQNLTELAREGKLSPVIGRDKEIDRLSQILCRKLKNNPILIGEPGVGKTAIVEGLALRIASKKVNSLLFNKELIQVDLNSMVAGTRYRGDFENRMKNLINEVKQDSNIILFIDEIHTIVKAGGNDEGDFNAANALKPALSRGEIKLIGATTIKEFKKTIEKDGALNRRFQKILIEQPTEEETLEILNKIKPLFEKHHNVEYTDEAIKACVELTERYLPDKFFPDKAIDVLDESATIIDDDIVPVELRDKYDNILKLKTAAIKINNFNDAAKYYKQEQEISKNIEDSIKCKNILNKKLITKENVSIVISKITGIPTQEITKNENEKLSNMCEIIGKEIIGQTDAIESIADTIKRSRIGLRDPKKPIGSFLFIGPTGVGKTELTKSLSKFLFNTEDSLIKIDMSEYMEKFNVSKLIGAAPGYIGYSEGGQLTEKVKRHPYSIVVFDEIEKADPDVFNILLQILDDGILTDANGDKIDFKNTIIIMTSNIGSQKISEFNKGIGFANNNKINTDIYYDELKKKFSPEFLNRIDNIVLFNNLTKNDIKTISNIEIDKLKKRMESLNYKFEVTEKALDFIANDGYDVKYGARSVKRSIQDNIENKIANFIIENKPDKESIILIDYYKNKIIVKLKEIVNA